MKYRLDDSASVLHRSVESTSSAVIPALKFCMFDLVESDQKGMFTGFPLIRTNGLAFAPCHAVDVCNRITACDYVRHSFG
jgi:hypothetical protein